MPYILEDDAVWQTLSHPSSSQEGTRNTPTVFEPLVGKGWLQAEVCHTTTTGPVEVLATVTSCDVDEQYCLFLGPTTSPVFTYRVSPSAMLWL